MPGVRIRHEKETNCTFVLVDPSRRYREALLCMRCSGGEAELATKPVVHLFKTYHIVLDDSGHAIVSTEIWGHLERMRQQGIQTGFAVANEVKSPPAQRVVPGVVLDHRQIVTHQQS